MGMCAYVFDKHAPSEGLQRCGKNPGERLACSENRDRSSQVRITLPFETLPVEQAQLPRSARGKVPSWQMFGQPHALRNAPNKQATSDTPAATGADLGLGKPLLVLDFDGVISPLPTTRLDRTQRGHLLFHSGNPNYVYILAGYGTGKNYWVPLDLIERAADLAAQFDIVWASSWGPSCRPLGALLGWATDLPWIDLRHGYGPMQRAKAIREIAGEERTVVWCDDQQTRHAQQHLSTRPGHTLCVRPAKRYGLRAKHLDQILTIPTAKPAAHPRR